MPGRRLVRRLNVNGDGQGDLAAHGGEQRAVLVYQLESYRYWQGQLKRTDFVHGQFGENFTIEGLPDDAACVGDRYQIGNALFEITQPRVTCYRVGIRMARRVAAPKRVGRVAAPKRVGRPRDAETAAVTYNVLGASVVTATANQFGTSGARRGDDA